MTCPEISVLLPFRDAEATLLEAMESILDQRGVDLELIAVDDGSRDRSRERAARVAKDRRVVLVRGDGAGIAAALTLALAHARADWIARMDADDVAFPDRLARQLHVLRKDPHLGALGTRVQAFPEEAIGPGLARYVAWQNSLVSPVEHARDLFVESPLCHPSVLLRRAALEAAGGYRDVPWAEDYDLWLRLDALGWRLAKVPEVLLGWRHHGGRATFNDPRFAQARFVEAKGRYLAPRLRTLGRAVAIWGAGPTGRRLARALEAEGVVAERFLDIDPRKIGRMARGAPILPARPLERGSHTILVAVGARGARELIRRELDDAGHVEGIDYVCAA